MTFEAREESKQDGIPASLYLIEYGDTETSYFAYTDTDVAVTFDGKVFSPTTIGREKIEASGNLDKSTLEIDITPNASVVSLYHNQLPSQVIRLTIWQGHVDDADNDFKVVWTGRIISISRPGRFARINAEPISTSMRRTGLRRHYQYGCPWALYNGECGASKAAATETVAATGVGQNYVEFADGWQGAPGKSKYLGGFIQWTDNNTQITQTRTILAFGDNSNQLVVNGTIFGLDVGENVGVVLGCNHQMSDCADLHNNIVNFGGQPWIPKQNPTELRNQFY